MTTRNYEVGVVLTPAALMRVRRVADATTPTAPEAFGYGSQEDFLAVLGDHWVQAAAAVCRVTGDLQQTQDVLSAALNRAARKARGA